MRYRGKCDVIFVDDCNLTIEHVVDVDDVETANKICAIEFHGKYRHNDRVKEYYIVPCVEDTMVKPSTEFIKERLMLVNNTENTDSVRKKAINELYTAFREYQPFWDDDGLSDVLSYCEDGAIESYGKIDSIVDSLAAELDSLWCCHYVRPGIMLCGHITPSLDEQYQQAIS